MGNIIFLLVITLIAYLLFSKKFNSYEYKDLSLKDVVPSYIYTILISILFISLFFGVLNVIEFMIFIKVVFFVSFIESLFKFIYIFKINHKDKSLLPVGVLSLVWLCAIFMPY